MARHHLLLCFLLLISFSIAAEDDAAIMTKFSNLIWHPPSTWKTEKHFCKWEGITCDNSSSHVISINLAGKSLVGTLPSDLNKLSHLKTLDLQRNKFDGDLPNLANLTFLQHLDLYGNRFTSTPHDFFFGLSSSLQYLDISSNSYLPPWVLPANLTQFTNLRSFKAGGAIIEGAIPESFTSLTNLQDLILSHNNLTGILPSHLNNLTQLRTLDLAYNGLSGHLPTFQLNLTLLQQLNLSNNAFLSISPDFFHGLINLQQFRMEFNSIRVPWSLPNDLAQCTKLELFSAYSANLIGPIPDTFHRLSKLQHLDLSDNNLNGSLPSHLNNLSNLNIINLSNNLFSGALPTLANLSSLERVSLDKNMFASIPLNFFLGLTNLKTFNISDNSFLEPWVLPYYLNESTELESFEAVRANINGSIPDIFYNSRRFWGLYLSYNNLTGTLPASFGGSSITRLKLDNQLQGLSGTLDVISSMTHLDEARLEANDFSGPIPDLSNCTGLTILQLGSNQLTGLVPNSLTKLPSLANITLQNNRLQGTLPVFKQDVEKNLDNNSFCLPVAGEKCDQQVTALLEVAKDLGYPMSLAESWKGNDACAGWKFITCDSSRKNVTVVNFEKQKFSGIISPSFGKLARLRNLSLSENNLWGSIPENLTSLKDLQFFDVSNNNLSGDIPKFPSNVKFLHNNNTLLGKRSNDSLRVVISSVIVSVLALAGIVLLVSYKCHRNSRKSHTQITRNHGEIPIYKSGNVMISMQLLEQVTDSFSNNNVLGRGGFGTVYKGELHDGTKIAVKKMKSDVNGGTKGIKEFDAEIEVLTKVRHRHLVALLGYCINDNERLLVYEYMPQGTLSQHLFKWREHKTQPLSWNQRVSIALDVGRGVEYMHNLAQQSFIHRDLKPANILLDDDMRAKVADFGLVKNAPDGKYSIETRLAGTFGYLAPEYAATGRVTTKVDVFAFGVVLMQLITSRKALDGSMSDERCQLVTWFRKVPACKENMVKFIDQVLDTDDSETLESILKVAELAHHCTAPEPFERPNMGYVVGVLAHLVEEWNPSRHKKDQTYGHKHHMSLPQMVQDDEDTSRMLNLFRLSSF